MTASEDRRWKIEARRGNGETVSLELAVSLETADQAYLRLVAIFPEYGPWQARRGDEVVVLPRKKK